MSDKPPISARVCLGTAQIGFDYGVANTSGRPDDMACDKLLSRAVERGVLRWDTAPAYGDAEQRIGGFLARCPRRDEIQIVSKLQSPPSDLAASDLAAWVTAATDASLKALQIDRLSAWLIHDPDLFARYGTALWDAMSAQVDRGVVQRIGASVYDVAEVQVALQQPATGAVQVTVNLLDDRFARAGVFDQCTRRDITVYARSVLLQGVLTMQLSGLPARLSHLRPPLERLHALLAEYGMKPLDVALPYVLSYEQVDFAVIGVDDVTQLDENLSRAANPLPAGLVDRLRSEFDDLGPEMLEPRTWPS